MPARQHNFTWTEIKAGAMVIAGLALFAVFAFVVTGRRLPSDDKTFYAFFTDTSGLNPGADVRFGGAKVGRVGAIDLDPDDPTRIRVTFAVPRAVPVNAESEAFVTQTTLTAEKHLEVTTGSSAAAVLAAGDTVTVRPGGLFDLADQIARSVKGMLDDLEELLGVDRARGASAEGERDARLVTIADVVKRAEGAVEEGGGLVRDMRGVVAERRSDLEEAMRRLHDIEDSAHELVREVNAVLAENRPDLRETVAGARAAMDGAREGVEHLSSMLERVGAVAERLDTMADALQAALDNTQSLTGDARDLVNRNEAALDDIIVDTRATVRYLRDFARTIAEQPQSVVRGAAPQGRRP